MIKTIKYKGKTIEFKCIMIDHPQEECYYYKHCKLEALHYVLKDFLKDCYLCPHILEKVIIKGNVIDKPA